MMDKRVALAWHDATCPEAEECRSRDLHSQGLAMVTSGALDRFLSRLDTLSDRRIPTDTVSDANHQKLRRALADLVEAADTPVAERDRHEVMAPLWFHAREVLAETEGPRYPETKFLTLCTLESRKSGRVTVGQSRLPVEMVLSVLRAHGPAEAETQWPQLTADELAVLAQLAADLDVEDLPNRAEVLAELAHDDLCDSPGPHCECGTAQTVDKMVEHGWLRFAGEPGGRS